MHVIHSLPARVCQQSIFIVQMLCSFFCVTRRQHIQRTTTTATKTNEKWNQEIKSMLCHNIILHIHSTIHLTAAISSSLSIVCLHKMHSPLFKIALVVSVFIGSLDRLYTYKTIYTSTCTFGRNCI